MMRDDPSPAPPSGVGEMMCCRDAAQQLGVHPATMRRWLARGALGARRCGAHWRASRAAVERAAATGEGMPVGAYGARAERVS